jgi:uncharacterized protein
VTSLNLANAVPEFLKERAETRFTAREIAEMIVKQNPDAASEKAKRSKQDVGIVAQVAAEVNRGWRNVQRNHPQFKTTEDRPRRFYWTEKSDETAAVEAENGLVISPRPELATSTSVELTTDTLKEHELYDKLSEYLWEEWGLYSKRIDETKSSNRSARGGNKWLYPDIVAMEDLTQDWTDQIKQLVEARKDKASRLWSFEVKILLNRANVREYFSQALSNSAWANFGYLVATEIAGDNETMREYRMLYGLHGIGLIRLNPNEPTESEIVVYARERQDVDWSTCSRLADENSDFNWFMKSLLSFAKSGEVPAKGWDRPKT